MDHRSSLKFGQVVRVHHWEKQGLLISKGFTDQNVYFMATSNVELDNNYRDSLFQILPRGTFEIHDEFIKLREIAGPGRDVLIQRMKAEAQQYSLSIQSRMNEEIHFGSQVIFKHLDSQEYLVGSYQCSEFSMDAFKLKLSQQLSSQTIFKLCPYQTYQKEGQIIFIGEPLIIQHEKSLCRIDFVEGAIFLDQTINYDDIEMQNDQFRPTIKRPMNKRAEAVIGLNSISQWQFKLHYTEGLIKPYDRCFLQYTQNMAYLCAKDGHLILKKFKNPEVTPLEAVWEVQPVSHVQTITESQHHQRNAIQRFVLRHHLSGQVITEKGRLADYLQSDSEHLVLQAAKAGIEELSYNVYVKIKAERNELQMLDNEERRIRKESSYSSMDTYYKQLSPEDLDYISFHVGFRPTRSLHGFQIKRISEESKRDLLLISSSHETLQQFCEALRLPVKRIEQMITESILSQVQTMIQQLIGYVLNVDYQRIENNENLPLKSRQIYLKDLQIVEIIMQIIYFISMKNDLDKIFKHRKSEREKLRLVYKLSYLLIEKMTKSNPQVKLFISQWLELFLHQAMSIADVQVQNSLSELLDDNYYAINKFITKKTLERLVSLISQRIPHEKYLRIFSCIVICNGKAIINNQISILNMFYTSSTHITSSFKFQLKLENQKVWVLSKISDFRWRTLKQLHQDSQTEDDCQSWYYFLAYINLLSDICQNRNKFGKKYIQENFDLAVLCAILEDPETAQVNAIEPFLRLIHTAYIDCQHYTPIRRIARVREWHTIEQKNDILRTHAEASLKPENCDLKRVMVFISSFLEQFEYFQVKQKTYNQLLFTVLSVLKTTLRLGFWKSITDLKELLPNLFKVMQCSKDISEYELEAMNETSNRDLSQISKQSLSLYLQSKVKLTKMSQDTIIIMKCKTLACEIVDIIIDMETNVRVSKSTQILKQLINNPIQSVNQDVTKLDDYIYDTDYWIDVFSNMIEERNIFTKIEGTFMEVLFAELTCFESSSLLQYAVKLLNRIYGQRKELILNFEKILIVASGFTFTLSVDSRVTRTKLLSLNDRNIFQANLENQKDFNIFLWRESSVFKESGVIQDLAWLCECLKKGSEVGREEVKIAYESLFPTNRLYQVYTEREENHKLHQSLIKCQDLHENIMIFLQQAKEIQNNELLMKMLHACYNFLTMIIWNHYENKLDFVPFLKTVTQHVQYNVGSILFLRELFINNKMLLFSESRVTHVSELVVQACNDQKPEFFYKSQLLDFLRVLLLYNNKVIKLNQNIIMAILQDRRFTNIMLYFNNQLLTGIEDLILEYENSYLVSLKTLQPVHLSSQLTYIFNYFQLMALLIEDRNEINCGKCRQMHPHDMLLKMYSQCGQCWPLKRYLRAYINKLYYNQFEYAGITQLIIELDIENIVSDLREIVELRTADIELDSIELANPTRYAFLASYVYLTLEENLITLNTILNRQKFLDDLEDTLLQNFSILKFKLHLELLEMGSLINQVQNLWRNSKFISNFTQILLTVFRSIYKTFDLSLLIIRDTLWNSIPMKTVQKETKITHKKYKNGQVIAESTRTLESTVDPCQILNEQLELMTEDPDDLNNEEKVTRLKEQMIEQLLSGSNLNRALSQIVFDSRPSAMKTRKFDPLDQNVQLNQKHQKLIRVFAQSERFQKFIEQEFYQVCEKLSQIDEESIKLYQTHIPVINQKDFIQNIISLILNEPEALSEDLQIFFLKLLGRMITEKNLNNKELISVDVWTPEFWSQFKQPIEEAQNLLEGCGGAELICAILKEPGLETRVELSNQLLSFGIAFLLGGNPRCQNAILKKMQADSQNLMMNNFRHLIKRISRAVVHNFKIRKLKQEVVVFNVISVDNYNQYDNFIMKRQHLYEEDDQKEERLKRSFVMILNRAFRFLQLLCENNNSSMKNFIRQQTDLDGSLKINSINFIEFATSQLRIYFKILNKNLSNVPNFILDFIIEVSQVPCLENQLTLCKTTLFEDSCYLLQHFSVKDHLSQRQLFGPEEQQILQQIYNKILIAIMTVLEGNDDRLYEDLQNKIEPSFLIEIVNQNLSALKVQSAKDMQSLLENQSCVFSDEIVKILNVIIIREKIAAKCSNHKWQMDASQRLNDKNFEIMSMLAQRILKIEIVYEGKPQTILFPAHSLFTYLSDETKDKIMFNINRETQRDKILGLLNQKSQIFNELEYNYKLSQLKISVTARSLTILSQVSAFFSILVNILMVLSYHMDIMNKMAFLVADFWESIVINMLAFCQLSFTILYYIFYLIYRVPLCMKGREAPVVVENYEAYEEISPTLIPRLNKDWKFYIGLLILENIRSFKSILQKRVLAKVRFVYNKVYQIIDTAYFLISNEEDFIRISVYLLFSLMGTFIKSYFFSLHLFDLFSRLSLLRNVFQAISYNAKQLVVVSLLGVLFIYVFSFTSFDSYVDEIYTDSQPEEHCETLISCMITLVTSGVIGTSMQKWDFVKFFYDTLYFVFFALLFTNIISGIMIDTFAELRDQRQKIEDDKKNKCFVCGVERVQLEKNQEIFEEHIRDKHYLWNYIYYMYCLTKKDSTEYTGLEYAISGMIEKENLTWFPIQQDNEQSGIEERLEKLETDIPKQLNSIMETVQQLLLKQV